MNNQRAISVLNDLLQITNDRIEGFEKVEGKVWEMYPDVKDEYDHMIFQSKIMKNELTNLNHRKKRSCTGFNIDGRFNSQDMD